MTHSPFYQSPDAYDPKDIAVFVEPLREAILTIMGSGSTPEARYTPLTVEVLTHRLDLAGSVGGFAAWPRQTRERIVAMILHMTNRHPLALLVSPGGEIRPPEEEMAELWGWFMAAGGRYEGGGECFPMVACPLARLVPQEELRARLGSEERIAAFTQRFTAEVKENTEMMHSLARDAAIKFESHEFLDYIQHAKELRDSLDE